MTFNQRVNVFVVYSVLKAVDSQLPVKVPPPSPEKPSTQPGTFPLVCFFACVVCWSVVQSMLLLGDHLLGIAISFGSMFTNPTKLDVPGPHAIVATTTCIGLQKLIQMHC